LAVADVEDSALARFCVEQNEFSEAEKAWHSVLAGGLRGARLLVKVPRSGGEQWLLSLGSGAGSAIIGMPVKIKLHQGQTFFTFDTPVKTHNFLCITDWTETKAWQFEWKSPLSIRLSTGKWIRGVGDLLMQPTTLAPETLLVTAAKMHFGRCQWLA
jgi:hypothetical protein